MKKAVVVMLSLLLVVGLFGCGESSEETHAKSILNSVQAIILPEEEQVDVVVEEIEHIKTQTAHNNEYSYYIVKTHSHDWGYAEFKNGDVYTYYVGYSKSIAKTRCKDLAEYRTSKAGGLFE